MRYFKHLEQRNTDVAFKNLVAEQIECNNEEQRTSQRCSMIMTYNSEKVYLVIIRVGN